MAKKTKSKTVKKPSKKQQKAAEIEFFHDYMIDMMREDVPSILREAADIFEQRSNEYGSVRESFDAIRNAHYGLTGNDLSPTEVAKFLMSVKLGRLAVNDCHEDSYLDLAVYSCICLSFVRMAAREAAHHGL